MDALVLNARLKALSCGAGCCLGIYTSSAYSANLGAGRETFLPHSSSVHTSPSWPRSRKKQTGGGGSVNHMIGGPRPSPAVLDSSPIDAQSIELWPRISPTWRGDVLVGCARPPEGIA